MIKNKKARLVLLLTAAIIGYYGFTFVTQAGQAGVVIQNDGYAGTGGFMILTSGFIIGVLVDRGNNGKKR